MRALSFVLLAFYLWKMAEIFDDEDYYRAMAVFMVGSWICAILSLIFAFIGV